MAVERAGLPLDVGIEFLRAGDCLMRGEDRLGKARRKGAPLVG